ncbi:MAG: RNA methyltransferase [Bacteroidota bacterium]|nr:RNA methyltransferase [Bacteroidota bacterium]
MLSKNKIKFINSLQQNKFREEHGLFIAEGMKIVPELLDSAIVVKEIFGTPVFISKHSVPVGIEVTEVSPSDLARISSLSAANEVLAVCQMPVHELNKTSFKEKLTLILDEIKDPGNLGTIIRIADWFGIEDIVCSQETVGVFNPKVVQSTMGSVARIRVHYTDLAAFLEEQKSVSNISCFGALLEGENVFTADLSSSGFIVIGNESKGISEKIQSYITNRISIPSFSHFRKSGGEAESLNAAIATSIICSEFRRRTSK